MRKPIVAIVGRPNVGKSTLFNRIIGRRAALVEALPGVTRDRHYGPISWQGTPFVVVDTGGFEGPAQEGLYSQVLEQTLLAVEEADLVLAVFDLNEGLTPIDREIVDLLRHYGKPFLVVINKTDTVEKEKYALEFSALGVEPLLPVSAEHGQGVAELLDEVVARIKSVSIQEEAPAEGIRVALLGRPNVGKSSLLNSLLGKQRVIVDESPGTTRDAIDAELEVDGRRYVLIDTAGIRRKGRVTEKIEKYSVIMALKNLERCDVALLLLDASTGIMEQDTKIAGYIHDSGAASVLLLNKWDLVPRDPHVKTRLEEDVRRHLKFLDYAPLVRVSARTGAGVQRILPTVCRLYQERQKRISTSTLNSLMEEVISRNPPSQYRGKPVKFFYHTQLKLTPPSFVSFVNHPEGIHFSYLRYLKNSLRDRFGFEGNPLRIFLRARRERG